MLKNDMTRENMMKKVQMYSFAVLEATLFLDTHPTDKDALKYYNKYRELHKEATEDFTKYFGPVTLSEYEPENRWSWVDEPWPWEMEG